MIKVIVALFDEKSERFHDPAFVPALGAAVRGLEDAVKSDEKGDLQKHPGDFKLYELGTYDDNSGVMELINPPRFVIGAGSFKE